MNDERKICPDCGEAMPGDAPHGLCPKCLLPPAIPKEVDAASGKLEAKTVVLNPGESRAVRSKAQVRHFGDYELTGEIAHGGMGIVYKARQVSLNRTVAVKMILSGQFATESEVDRFQSEAEAAASLRHPNIVGIHEVGEHEGQRYFSMEFVDGADLSVLVTDGPLSAAQAARYARSIAEAIHYAHERGILHRDLKPQNVLIDRDDEPRVTDFGLAKRVDEADSLTATGAVIGSPQYMSPEQAKGDKERIGPQSDVYGIGVVLYFLMTGRPPFQGATAVETLHQVIEAEPPSLRKLNPKTPQDLETICLKCLEKRPELRYASAAEVAEELGRFLNYEPIHARPASAVRKTWSWTQKNPWVFAGVVTAVALALLCLVYGLWEKVQFVTWQKDHPGESFQPPEWTPVVTFFKTLPLICLLIFVAGKSFRRTFQANRDAGLPVGSGSLVFHALLGAGSALIGILMLMLLIRSWVWAGTNYLFALELLGVVCIAWLVWEGMFMAWESLGAHETSMFGHAVDQRVRRQLDGQDRQWPLWQLLALPASLWVAFAFISQFGIQGLTKPVNNLVAAVLCGVASLSFAVSIAGSIARRSHLLWRVFAPVAAVLFGGFIVFISIPMGLLRDMGFGSLVGLALSIGVAIIRERQRRLFTKAGEEATAEKAFPGNPTRQAFACFLGTVGALVGFYQLENWRGAREWRECQAEMEERQIEFDPGSFLPPEVPDDENFGAIPLLRETVRRAEPRSRIVFDAPVFKEFGFADLDATHRALRDKWPEQYPAGEAPEAAVLRTLKRVDAEMAELRLASCRRHSVVCLTERERANPAIAMSQGGVNFVVIRNLAHVFSTSALANIEAGNLDLAIEDLRVCAQAARLGQSDNSLVGAMMGSAVVGLAVTVLDGGQLEDRWSSAQLLELQSIFGDLEILAKLTMTGIPNEAARLILQMNENEGRELPKFRIDEYDVVRSALWPRGWFDQNRVNVLRGTADYWLAAYDPAIRRLEPDAVRRAFAWYQELRRKKHPFSWAFAQGFFNWSMALERASNRQANCDFVVLNCALERYRRERGAVPDSLGELVPDYIAELPHDRLSGKAYGYRKTVHGSFTLYGVGWDGRDHGGARSLSADGNSYVSDDWIWPSAPPGK